MMNITAQIKKSSNMIYSFFGNFITSEQSGWNAQRSVPQIKGIGVKTFPPRSKANPQTRPVCVSSRYSCPPFISPKTIIKWAFEGYVTVFTMVLSETAKAVEFTKRVPIYRKVVTAFTPKFYVRYGLEAIGQ